MHCNITTELATYLLKLIDFIEDDDESRKQREIDNLSYLISTNAANRLIADISLHTGTLDAVTITSGDMLCATLNRVKVIPDKLAAKLAIDIHIKTVLHNLRHQQGNHEA